MPQKSKTPAGTGALGNGLDDDAHAHNSSTKADRNRVLFSTDGRLIKPRGGLARILGMMVDGDWEGIDRHMCGEWCADLPAAICKLRKSYGLNIETVKGRPTRYVLLSPVCREGGRP